MEKYTKTPVGERIKHWREQKGISQFDLALECDTSAKHLSFIETGRAKPARDLLLNLLTVLEVPLEAKNNLLISAGLAPSYAGTGLAAKEFNQALMALDTLLANNIEQPTALIDQNWQLIKYNQAFRLLCERYCSSQALFTCPSPNLLSLLLHPEGLIASVVDKSALYRAFYSRVRRVIAVVEDSAVSKNLMEEIISYAPLPEDCQQVKTPQLMVPVTFEQEGNVASYVVTSVSLGDPLNVSLQERQLEMFMPM